uniref:tyrosine--tRNA ligase n=1 Tax=Echinostoma caproni TaxID=27848 RepID=A0A183B5R0_9TREM
LFYCWSYSSVRSKRLGKISVHNHPNVTSVSEFVSFSLPDAETAVENDPFSVYLGIDPSAPSLQLGNMVALLGLLRCHATGKNGILIGTSTVSVGDPSGRSDKRMLEPSERYLSNADRIEKQLRTIFHNYLEQIPFLQCVWNSDWLTGANMMTFLTDITSHFRMSDVKLRLSSGTGMDLSEFLYPVLQAMDFLHLYQKFDCQIQVTCSVPSFALLLLFYCVQIGGHDQLGNINCGLNLIRRKLNKFAFGKSNLLVFFLLRLQFPILARIFSSKNNKPVTPMQWSKLCPWVSTLWAVYHSSR